MLDPKSRVTLYDQLYGALRAEIERGGMAASTRMPSKRELSQHLGISTATVEAAYGRLASEGFCESRPRSGMFVSRELPGAVQPISLQDVPVRGDFTTGAADADHFPYAA